MIQLALILTDSHGPSGAGLNGWELTFASLRLLRLCFFLSPLYQHGRSISTFPKSAKAGFIPRLSTLI